MCDARDQILLLHNTASPFHITQRNAWVRILLLNDAASLSIFPSLLRSEMPVVTSVTKNCKTSRLDATGLSQLSDEIRNS